MIFSQENQFKDLRHKKVLVTGANGFIGSSLARELLHHGAKVVALVRPSSDLWRIADILDQTEVVFFDLSGTYSEDLKSRLQGIKIIFHLGAAGVDQSKTNFEDILKTNIWGTLQILELGRELKVERFIYCGSCSEYGPGQLLSEQAALNPLTEYDVSKTSGWMLAKMFHRKYALPVVTLRLFTVYGPYEARHRLIPAVINNILEHRAVELTGGEQTRDFVFIQDVVHAFCLAATASDVIGETFNISTGQEVSVKQVTMLIVELMGADVKPVFGARPYRTSELWKSSGDPSLAAEKLKWRCQTDLRDGLLKTIHWHEQNRSQFAHYQTVGNE